MWISALGVEIIIRVPQKPESRITKNLIMYTFSVFLPKTPQEHFIMHFVLSTVHSRYGASLEPIERWKGKYMNISRNSLRHEEWSYVFAEKN